MASPFSLHDLDPPIVVEPPQPAKAVVIWLHGLGADGHDFAGLLPQLNLPSDHRIRFVFPHAPIQPVTVNGGMSMRSWYDIYSLSIADKMDLTGIEAASAVVEALIEQQSQQGIERRHMVLAGFSQGGLVALHTGLHSKHDLAGILALSTYYPQACLDTGDSNQLNSRIPIMMVHGLYDLVIPLSVAEASRRRLEGLKCPVEWHDYPMEHQVCYEEIARIAEWLQQRLATAE